MSVRSCGRIAGVLILPLQLAAAVSADGGKAIVESPELDAWALIGGGLLLVAAGRYFRGVIEKRRHARLARVRQSP